jgi:hypothetical protein
MLNPAYYAVVGMHYRYNKNDHLKMVVFIKQNILKFIFSYLQKQTWR